MHFTPLEDVLGRLAEGGVVIVVDDEHREDEGDFICAAEKMTPATLNFMVTHGRGQFCVALLPERAEELRLEPAFASTSLMRTNYTTSVDLRTLKTGISASERALTVRALVDPRTRPEDLARPGHVQPLIAQHGGVLRRAGHTEAAVDLARLAGLRPAGALIEILDTDGEVARRPRLEAIAREQNLPITSVGEILRHRRRHEKLVSVVARTELPTRWGAFQVVSYDVDHESMQPFALVLGDIEKAEAPLIRMHSSCFTGDVLGSLRCDCGDQLHMALDKIAAEGAGAVVYLPQEGRGIGLQEKIKAYALQDAGADTVEANVLLGFRADMRDYGIGLQILKDLGLRRIRLLTNNPKKTESFIYYGYDIEVVDQIELWPEPNGFRERYMHTKCERMGHTPPASRAEPSGGLPGGLPGGGADNGR